jgi:guanosine-3',5'-bis(diphosphate) 3'-pyrophosphohydrolase
VNHLVAKRQEEQRAVIEQAIQTLREELKNAGLEAEVSGRTKNLYGLYRKMERYQEQGKDFGDIHDILALRVVVREVADCYHALGVVHSLWHPLAGEFDDYIASPKENGYQSLHTTVMCFGTTPLEIQIRTYEMQHSAEFGVTAHWLYKEGSKADTQFERRISWFRQLLEWHKEIGGTAEFLESVKTDLFNDQVYVYTPKGEIKDLPIGSTPLDFAYCIHTNIGHRCIGAKVNGRLQPLNHTLRNGDTVEVIVSKKSRGPSRDWLNPHLGYIKSSRAKQRVRQWFNKREQEENLERGKEILDKELKRLGISQPDREAMALLFKYKTVDEFYIAIGCGDLSSNRIALKLAEEQDQPKLVQPPSRTKHEDKDIRVLGVGQLLTSLGRCCNPLPGDEVIGYITRTKGVTIHRRSCPNIGRVDDEKRLVSVDWGGGHDFYPAVVRIDAWDRLGLLRDICTLVTDEGVNIVGVSSTEGRDHTTSLLLTLETQGMAQLTRILAKLEGINNVISVTRCTTAR